MLESEEGPDFDAIDDLEQESLSACRESLLAAIARAVSRADDPRIAARVLDEIDFTDLASFETVLRAALAHPSAGVRRHAARAASEAEDPMFAAAIEDRFEVEADEGVRRDLIRALARTGSRRFLPELRKIATSLDPVSREVALDALILLPDADSVELFESIAMGEASSDAVMLQQIVHTLATWKDIPTAGAALRKVGRTGPPDAAWQAIRELSNYEDGDLAALVEIASARSDGDPQLRDAALRGIEFMTSPEAPTRVAFGCGAQSNGKRFRGLPLASGSYEEFGTHTVFVVPRGGEASARCWDAPGFMWPGEIRPRVPSGTSLVVWDEFSWQDETWFAVIEPRYLCWLPETDLSDEEPAPLEDDTVLDVDVTQDDAASWAARALEIRGWSTPLESEGEVVLLSLDAIPNRETVAEMVRIRRLADSPAIELAIGRWLYANARWLDDDEELGSGIPDRDPRWAEPDEEEDEPPTEP